VHFGTLKRREFIFLLGSATIWPRTLRGQQPPKPVIGFLSSGSPDALWAGFVTAFRQGLSESGFVDGQNVLIEFRWAEGQYNRLPKLAADLISLPAAVILAAGGSDPARVTKRPRPQSRLFS
jgi:putative ABC transport system substrate-binding protein